MISQNSYKGKKFFAINIVFFNFTLYIFIVKIMITHHDPLSKRKTELIRRLDSLKIRRKEGLFLVEGSKCVTDTLGKFPLSVLAATPAWLNLHKSLIADYKPATFEASAETLAGISSLSTPPEVIAVYEMPERKIIIDEKLEPGLYLMLDGVQDPGNLGTIIRTAHWFGIQRIFVSSTTVDVYNPKVIQSTMGSIADVEVIYCDLTLLAEANPGIPVCILDLAGENIFEHPLPKSAFIAMGNEGNGLTDNLKKKATLKLTIPPASSTTHPDSLNVAIATAIAVARFRNS